MSLINIQYEIELFGQPTGMTCWSAATTMLLGSRLSVGPGKSQLANNGGLKSDFDNVIAFANSYGLKLFAPQSWTLKGLTNLISTGPVVMIGSLPSLHAVVIGGINSDGTINGTELTIYDPWPPNKGEIYTASYALLMSKFPSATTYMLQK